MNCFQFSLIFVLGLVPFIICVVPGGWQELPVDDEVRRLSAVVLNTMNQGKGDNDKANLIEIVKAARQIVAGTNTRLTLKVNQEGAPGNHFFCVADVWEQPWNNKTEVTFKECEVNLPVSTDATSSKDVSKPTDVKLQLFNDFLKMHNKTYTNGEEYKKRFRIFSANLHKIQLLRKSEQGTAHYGLTQFSDLSAKEFKKYLGLRTPNTKDVLPPAEIPDIQLPDHVDWRNQNIVTPVKNQKYCGSCWAFSVTGNVEGQWALKHGELLSLSEQELIDCDSIDHGCEGGYMTDAYKAIMNIGGLETEKDYPYEGRDDTCHFKRTDARVQISGAVNITSDEVKMAKWLAKNGPMSVALNANAMQFYFGGVAHPLKFLCNPADLNHGVLIVGFGVHHTSILNRTLPYWIIKNSWGTHWGERGYYKLYRGDGSCGIDQMVSSAIVN